LVAFILTGLAAADPQADLTPGRVTQGLGALFAQFEHITIAPKTRGKSPGWPSGRSRTRLRRYPVLKRSKFRL